jgi:hypothetical protein
VHLTQLLFLTTLLHLYQIRVYIRYIGADVHNCNNIYIYVMLYGFQRNVGAGNLNEFTENRPPIETVLLSIAPSAFRVDFPPVCALTVFLQIYTSSTVK